MKRRARARPVSRSTVTTGTCTSCVFAIGSATVARADSAEVSPDTMPSPESASPKPLLEVRALTKRFGGLLANDHVDLTVGRAEIVGLIGPNGAGKTTLFNGLTGQFRIDEGRVIFDGRDLTNRPPEEIARAGIARTFQLVKVFREMTVLDNVIVGAFLRAATRRAARERAQEAIRIAGLSPVAASLAGELPVALQKRIE